MAVTTLIRWAHSTVRRNRRKVARNRQIIGNLINRPESRSCKLLTLLLFKMELDSTHYGLWPDRVARERLQLLRLCSKASISGSADTF